MDEAFTGLSRYHSIVDDVVIYDSDPSQHIDNVCSFLQQCADQQMTLNPEKWEFAKPQVSFAGFTLSTQDYSVDKSITDAITLFSTPTNHTDLRAFFGLANQLSASTATLTNTLAPLRLLLSTKNELIWTPNLNAVFSAAKQALLSAPIHSYFDLNKPTHLCIDASCQGHGLSTPAKER